MAESAMGGLFQTPEMYQQARLQQQQEEAARYAQMDPMQRATYGTYMAGQQLGSGIAQLFGVQDPQLRMISQQQRILGQIDPNDPESIAKGAQMAAQMGNNSLAAALATRAREAAATLAQIQQRTAEKQTPEQRNAEAMSALQEKITRITDSPENTPGREAALKSFTGQLANLQSLTAKTPPAQVKEIALAREIALQSGPIGSPEYNAAYTTSLRDQTTSREAKLPSMVEEYQFALTPAGGRYTGTFLEFVNSRSTAARTPPAAAAPGALTTITDPTDPTKTIVVQSGAYRGGGVGSPGVIGAGVKETGAAPISAKDRQTREAAYPKATSAVKGFEIAADNFAKDLETLAVHPGLASITGIAAGRLPGLTSAGRAAYALYDKIAARGGFQELQNLRLASPTGGALGNVSNQEGTQLKNAFAAINRTQEARDVSAALLRAAEETRASKGRVREAYDVTYEYRNPAGAVSVETPKTSVGGSGQWGTAIEVKK